MTNVKRIISTIGQGLSLPITLPQNNSDSDMESDLKRYGQEILDLVINPEKDYEVIKYRHKPYGDEEQISISGDGFNYRDFGYTQQELLSFSNAVKNSFYKFDFYDSLGQNRKKKFTKIIPMTISRDEPEIIYIGDNSSGVTQNSEQIPAVIQYLDLITGQETQINITGTSSNPQILYMGDRGFNNDFYDIIIGDVEANIGVRADICSDVDPYTTWSISGYTVEILKDGVSYFIGENTTGDSIDATNLQAIFTFDNAPILDTVSGETSIYNSSDNSFQFFEEGVYTINVTYDYGFDFLPSSESIILNRIHIKNDFFLMPTKIQEEQVDINQNQQSFSYVITAVTGNSVNNNQISFDETLFISFNTSNQKIDFFTARFTNLTDSVSVFSYEDNDNGYQEITLQPGEFFPSDSNNTVCAKMNVSSDGNIFYHTDLTGTTFNLLGNITGEFANDNFVLTEQIVSPTFDNTIRTIKPYITSNRYKDSELYNLYYFNEDIDNISEFYVDCRFFNGKTGEVIRFNINGDEFIKCVLDRDNKTYEYVDLNDTQRITDLILTTNVS